jgi:hypothetical protein
MKQWTKVKGVFTEMTSICDILRQATHRCEQDSISISLVQTDNDVFQQQQHRMKFIAYCREKNVGNVAALRILDKLEQEYHHHVPIWWYTYSSFLFSVLNRALRTMKVVIIIKLGFFRRDLHY